MFCLSGGVVDALLLSCNVGVEGSVLSHESRVNVEKVKEPTVT